MNLQTYYDAKIARANMAERVAAIQPLRQLGHERTAHAT
jgi:hypothetical protein